MANDRTEWSTPLPGEENPRPTKRLAERKFIEVRGQAKEGLVPPEYSGSVINAGGAYLFQFPFDIYIADEPFEIQTSYVDGTQVTIYPIFRNAAPEISRVEPENMPFRPGTVPPTFNKVGVKSITMNYDWGWRADALRLDFQPDRGPEFATQIAEQLIGLVRWWTAQWWIGRDRRHTEDYLRNWFSINEVGERLSGINGFASTYGRFGNEQLLDLQKFRNIRGNITHGRHIPLSWDTFFDGIYFRATLQLRRSVLETAIACEAKIVEEAQRISARDGISNSRRSKALSSDDFSVKLDKGIQMLVGRRFRDEAPEEFDKLKLLRTARGNVAHGGIALIPEGGGSRVITADDMLAMLHATLKMFKWLEAV